MKPGFVAKAYRLSLHEVACKTCSLSLESPWKGRAAALPLSAFLLLSIPLQKCVGFFEALLFSIANLAAPLFPRYCSYYDIVPSLRQTAHYLVGLFLSPITAPFAASALLFSMLVDPIAASKRFVDTSRIA